MADLNITQPAFSGGIISTELFSRLDFAKIDSGLKQCENFVVRPSGGAIFRTGTRFIAEAKYPDKRVSLIPFVVNRNDGFCLEFGDKYIRVYKRGDQIVDGEAPVEIETTYLESEVAEIKFAQNKNDLYLVHKNHPPAVLTRTSDTQWALRDIKLNPNDIPKLPEAPVISGSTGTVNYDHWKYAISCVTIDDEEGFVIYSNEIEADIDLLQHPITVKWKRPTSYENIKEYRIYRIKAGEYYLVYIQEENGSEEYSLSDASFAPNEAVSPKEEFDAFEGKNYPRAVGMWNQRLILGGTDKQPNTFWLSRVGEPEDFTTTIVNAADDGIELTFSSGSIDAITDFVSMDDLIVFTEGKIWRVSGTSASNMRAIIESYTGACGIRPFATKKSILFVDNSRNTISNFVYSYELNGYTGQNLDTLARQLLEGYLITDISYRDTPYSVMYAVRSDGTLLGLTYMREENIYAWHKHTTKGLFKAVCSVDGDQEDDVYVAVDRGGKIFIEIFSSYINEQQDIEDSAHLDCCTRIRSDVWSFQTTREVEDANESVLYEKTTNGQETVHFPNDGLYTITLVAGGGGGSNWWGAAGGYVKIIAELQAGDYTINVGAGGYGAPYYVRNNNGGSGGNSSVEGQGFKVWVDGGAGRTGRRNGSYHIKGAPTYHVEGAVDYTILAKNKVQQQQQSFYEGYGAGGGNQGYDKGSGYAGSSGYCKIVMQSISYHYEPADYIYTRGEPEVGGRAYFGVNSEAYSTIDAVSEDYTITVDGKQYEFRTKSTPDTEKVTGLERFEGQEVCIVVNTNVYHALVIEGAIDLPEEASSVVVGLEYEGILETIPKDRMDSSGTSTVGGMRKIYDGTLSYYRSRGLWYGRDYDHLYEIKPYTQLTYGEKIPLESGKLTLKTADGYTIENSFVVVQRSPMPALVQSITLGSIYNGKS